MKKYEEKYKEALKVMESLYNIVKYQSSSDALLTCQTIEKAFPELHESEDERIRKEIIQSIQDNMCVIHKDKCIAWLEKQGEQKPTWSEEYEKMPALVCPKCMKSFEKCEDYSIYHDRIRYICPHCEYDGDSVEFETSYKNHPIHSVTPSMIQWKGNNLKQVIEFTGKSPKFNEWFKSFEEYETYVREHNNIFKLFNEDGSNYEVPVGAWIVKTPDGYNVASKAIFKQKPTWSEEDEMMFGKCIDAASGYYSPEDKQSMKEWLRTIKDRIQPQPKQKWSKEDEEMFDEIIDFFENGTIRLQHDLWLYASWLKSLKERMKGE